jgi:hypothetical protein
LYVEADRTYLNVPEGVVPMRFESPEGSTVLGWEHRVEPVKRLAPHHDHGVPIVTQVTRFSQPRLLGLKEQRR